MPIMGSSLEWTVSPYVGLTDYTLVSVINNCLKAMSISVADRPRLTTVVVPKKKKYGVKYKEEEEEGKSVYLFPAINRFLWNKCLMQYIHIYVSGWISNNIVK